VIRLFRAWTTAAARMTRGEPAPPTERDAATVLPDSGEVHGLPPARLTLTFGFGAGLFLKDGKDRYGLAAQRPPALVELPPFDGDQLAEAKRRAGICKEPLGKISRNGGVRHIGISRAEGG
jgi:deferrochelatase/peroxidase EfeB